MKPIVSAADVRALREALGRFNSAEQWALLARELGVDMDDFWQRLQADKAIAEGLVRKLETMVGNVV